MSESQSNECTFCGGGLEDKEVRYIWERGSELAVIEGVHARVCRRCGHRWYPARSVHMLESAFMSSHEPVDVLQVPVYSLK